MSRSLARLAAIALGLAVSVPVGVGAAMLLPSNPVQTYVWFVQEQLWPGVETKLAEQAPARNKAILTELERLEDHPWAGVYRTQGQWPTVLAIAPEAGYTLHKGSWCGNCLGWRGMGQVVSADGVDLEIRVELGIERPPDTERSYAWYGLEPLLHLVQWGDLLFAVPPWRMELFCAEVSNGHTFPLIPFRYIGDDEGFQFDVAERPAGMPRVPSQYQPLILPKPISGTIVALVGWSRVNTISWNSSGIFEAVYSVDVGSQAGLVTGMHFYAEEGAWSRAFAGGRVEVVDTSSSRVTYLTPEEEHSEAEQLVGRQVTTQHVRTRGDGK